MHATHATIRLIDPEPVLDALLAHLGEHDIVVTREAGAAHAAMANGEAKFAIRDELLHLSARAMNWDALGSVATFLASHLREFAHPQEPTIRWAGLSTPRLPPDFREMTVIGVADLTPHMRRLTLTGADLKRFHSQDDLHVRLFLPVPGGPARWPMRTPDGLVVPVADAERPAVRKYTIRSIDLANATVEIDFVLHEDAGPGSNFAARAKLGDRLGMAGPGGRTARPAEWMLLVGDETALPAISRIAEGLKAETCGTILLEVERRCDRLAIAAPDGFRVYWLERQSGAVPLVEAVRSVPIPAAGTRFLWAGAEFFTIQRIREHWKNSAGIEKHEQLAVAYWKRGEHGR